jgi:serine/threonine-protein kinase
MSAAAIDGERFRRARRLFEEAVDLEPAQRAARLDALEVSDRGMADAVRELLSADVRAQSFLSSPGDLLLPPSDGDEPDPDDDRVADLRGHTIGVYRLLEPLGRGGMGEVYLAERADGRFEQRVAVKLVKRGMDTAEILRRFARERRILARLEHPGIARLLDGGDTADGRPYFVMERVEGEAITDYCRSRDLPLEDRLRLVISSCDATDAAHRSLVVHRDLKPSNILVTPEGEVKLLDFGIAKLLAEDDVTTQLTRHDGRVLTPAYAAPEQILGGAITVATDVFALGVVLYELLTGTLPHDRRGTAPHELPSRVERERAERPSTVVKKSAGTGSADGRRKRWVRRLRGDLDTITMKALARDPERRYPSAAALAEDLRRYLTSRPILARPDSRGYRLRKFVVRHRLGVVASGAAAAAVLAALAVSLAQTATARREAERAAAAQAFLTSLFDRIDPERSAGAPPTVRDLLERGSARLDQDLARQPEMRAEMHMLLGRVFDQLSLPDQGEAHWRRAVETRQALHGPGDTRTLRAKKGLAISLARQARHADAEPLFQELLEHSERLGDERERVSVLTNYGLHKQMIGEYAASEQLLERAVVLLEGAEEPDRRLLANALNNLGLAYWRQDREREAVEVIERALAIVTEIEGRRSGSAVTSLHNLAQLHHTLDDLDAAERYGREALAVEEAVYPSNHPAIASTLEALGQVAQKRGDRAGAQALYERSIAIYEASQRPDHPDLAFTLRHLALLLLENGDTEKALGLYERSLTVRRQAFGDRHPHVAESWHDLARARLALGERSGALEALERGVDIFRATLPAGSSQLAGGLFRLGDFLRLDGRPDEALPHLEEALAIWRRSPPTDPSDLSGLEAAIAAVRTAER